MDRRASAVRLTGFEPIEKVIMPIRTRRACSCEIVLVRDSYLARGLAGFRSRGQTRGKGFPQVWVREGILAPAGFRSRGQTRGKGFPQVWVREGILAPAGDSDPVGKHAGRDSRRSGCEKGFSHQREVREGILAPAVRR